jgi:hypothetical protein
MAKRAIDVFPLNNSLSQAKPFGQQAPGDSPGQDVPSVFAWNSTPISGIVARHTHWTQVRNVVAATGTQMAYFTVRSSVDQTIDNGALR